MPLATSRHLELISSPSLGTRARANLTQVNLDFFSLIADPDFGAVSSIGRRVMCCHMGSLDSANCCACQKMAHLLSLRRGTEKQKNFPLRACAGGGGGGGGGTRSGGGHLLLGINDQSFTWAGFARPDGEFSRAWVDLAICQGAAGRGRFTR